MCKRILSNNRGYTFIEAIFQLVVVAVVAHIIALVYIICRHWLDYEQQRMRLNEELFVSELNTYLMKTESFYYLQNKREIVMQRILSQNQYVYLFNSANHIGLKMASPTPGLSPAALSDVASGLVVVMPNTKMTDIHYTTQQLHIQFQPKVGAKWERTFIAPPLDE